MKKLLLLLCLAPLLMANHCEDDDRYYDDYPCTAEARAALNVNVTLNGSSAITAEGISVTARDGNYIEDLLPVIPDTPTFSGAYERTGNYIITVRKAGYQDYVSNNISVARDRCHVIPRQLTVNLIPE
jgi:hypothetical protein